MVSKAETEKVEEEVARKNTEELVLPPPEFERQTLGAFVMLFRYKRRNFFSKSELQVLLVHRNDYDLWNLPGGGCNPGEDPIDAAIREVLEKIGLRVGLIFPNASTRTYAGALDEESHLPGERRHDHFVTYVGSILGGELRISSEANEIRWFSITNLPENLYSKHQLLINVTTSEVWQTENMPKVIEYSIKNHKFIPNSLGPESQG